MGVKSDGTVVSDPSNRSNLATGIGYVMVPKMVEFSEKHCIFSCFNFPLEMQVVCCSPLHIWYYAYTSTFSPYPLQRTSACNFRETEQDTGNMPASGTVGSLGKLICNSDKISSQKIHMVYSINKMWWY